jgi:hypothetical protein
VWAGGLSKIHFERLVRVSDLASFPRLRYRRTDLLDIGCKVGVVKCLAPLSVGQPRDDRNGGVPRY